jgi:Peptidase propeptide and YPEB domain
MRVRFAVILSLTLGLLAVCLLAAVCSAQSTSHFQSVSGESARSYLDNLQVEDSESAEEEKEDEGGLWGWGGAPRGSKIVDGKLVVDPYYNLTPPNIINSWLGDAIIDPVTGYQIQAYVDPNTGKPVYYYIDPKTGQPVFTDVKIDPVTGEPIYSSLSPFYTLNEGPSGLVLPPVFSTDDPWA